jgi:hypothetical protein
MSLYQTLIVSISFYKLIDLISFIDHKIGSPVSWLVKRFEKLFFKGWAGIHPISFSSPEEDEGIWFFNFSSPAWGMFTPFYRYIGYLSVLDNFPADEKRYLLNYYKNSLKRIHYALGTQKTLVVKSVMASGRIKSYLELFPDARIIFIHRDPLKTVPSYISMFSVSWNLHSPKALKNKKLLKEMGESPIAFYKHFHAIRSDIDAQNLKNIDYENLMNDPLKEIITLYEFFGLAWDEELKSKWIKHLSELKRFKSRHNYSLEMYGFTKEELMLRLESA